MRTGHLVRFEDVSGVSGTGIVAEIAEFTSGKCVVNWMTKISSLVVYDNLEDILKIHGHGNSTQIVWDEVKLRR